MQTGDRQPGLLVLIIWNNSEPSSDNDDRSRNIVGQRWQRRALYGGCLTIKDWIFG